MITVSDLTPGQTEILETWATIARDNQAGSTFSLDAEAKHGQIEERLPQFIDNPSEETFKTLWNTIYSAQRAGNAGYFLDSLWGDDRTIDELAEFVAEMATSEEYDEGWEDQSGSTRPLREFFGWLHADSQPIIDMRTIRGLEFFDVVDSADSLKRQSFATQRERFAEFKSVYRAVIGHATEDTAHELPLNVEIYVLLVLVRQANKTKLREESNPAIAEFYRLVLDEKNARDASKAESPETAEEDDSASDVEYYWVSQSDPQELEGEYLSAPADDVWSHDLSQLEAGDIVFHYYDQQIIGHSTVADEASVIENGDEQSYRVPVEYDAFEHPRNIEDVREYLQRGDVRREKYYPLSESGSVLSAYLCRLTEDAADYLLKPQVDTNYFWISANPSIWKVDSIDDGGEVFYTAYNREGNPRRIQSAFEDAVPGDKVLFYESTPVKAVVAEGEIVEGLHEGTHEEYDEPVPGITIEYSRPIEDITWNQLTAVPDLENASPIANRAQGSLFHLTAAEYETILALEEPDGAVHGKEFEKLRENLTSIHVDFEVPDELYFEDTVSLRREIEASLNSGKHIIFTGPPGTGKTKLAKEICRQCVADLPQVDDHTFTTATSEWTAFDTIGGYVPSTGADESTDDLTFQPRLFLNCFRHEQDGIVNKWLVIDEINRSDIDKAFGQLFSVLSGDSVELPYERQNQVEIVSVDRNASDDELRAISSNPDVFPVTPSWRLLATMNTYDKASLYEMSYAFMRRFNFIHVGIPALKTADGTIRASLLDPADDENYAAAWLAADPSLESPLAELYRELSVIWKVVNDYPRSIGPSIVRDILGYVDAYGVGEHPERSEEALTAAIVGMVYPQLEGLRPDDQKHLVRKFAGEWETDRGDVTLEVDSDRLEAKAADYFDIRFDDE